MFSFFTVYYKHLHVTLRCIAILLAAFATVSIYRVSYFIIAAMAANVIHQALAPVALGMTRNTFFIRNLAGAQKYCTGSSKFSLGRNCVLDVNILFVLSLTELPNCTVLLFIILAQ